MVLILFFTNVSFSFFPACCFLPHFRLLTYSSCIASICLEKYYYDPAVSFIYFRPKYFKSFVFFFLNSVIANIYLSFLFLLQFIFVLKFSVAILFSFWVFHFFLLFLPYSYRFLCLRRIHSSLSLPLNQFFIRMTYYFFYVISIFFHLNSWLLFFDTASFFCSFFRDPLFT